MSTGDVGSDLDEVHMPKVPKQTMRPKMSCADEPAGEKKTGRHTIASCANVRVTKCMKRCWQGLRYRLALRKQSKISKL